MNARSVLILLVISTWVQAGESWTGKTVVAKLPEIGTRTKPDGAIPTEPAFGVLLVVRDEAGWFELKHAPATTFHGSGMLNTCSNKTDADELLPTPNVWGVKANFLLVSEALAIFSERIRTHPTDERGYLGRGRVMLHDKKNPDAALADFDAALKLNPKSRVCRLERSMLFEGIGAYKATVADLTELIRLDPKDALAYNNRGITLANCGKMEPGLADLREAIRLAPNQDSYRQNLALVLDRSGDPATAVSVMDEVIALYPRDARLYRTRGILRQNANDLDGALEDFDRALKLEPTLLLSQINRGWLRHLRNEPAKALQDLDEVLAKGLSHPLLLNNRAFVLRSLGRLQEAQADYELALQKPSTLKALVRSNLLNNSLDLAKKKVQDKPRDASVLVERASAYMDAGDLESALQDCDLALKLNPQSAAALHQRANVYMARGEVSRAITDVKEAIRLDPMNPLYPRNQLYFRIVETSQKPEPAALEKLLAEADALVQADPKSGNVRSHRGAIHLIMNNLDKALADLTEAIRLDPTMANAWGSRAAVHHLKGEADKAIADQLHAIELDPLIAATTTSLPEYYRTRKQYAQTMQALHQSISGLNPYSDGMLAMSWFLATCPKAEFRDGERALELGQQAGRMIEWSESKARSSMAAVFAELGDFEQAVLWEELSLLDPNLSAETRAGREARLKLYRAKKPYRDDQ